MPVFRYIFTIILHCVSNMFATCLNIVFKIFVMPLFTQHFLTIMLIIFLHDVVHSDNHTIFCLQYIEKALKSERNGGLRAFAFHRRLIQPAWKKKGSKNEWIKHSKIECKSTVQKYCGKCCENIVYIG